MDLDPTESEISWILSPSSACSGVIPMSFNNQRAAQLLAICNDIGEASYLESQVCTFHLTLDHSLYLEPIMHVCHYTPLPASS